MGAAGRGEVALVPPDMADLGERGGGVALLAAPPEGERRLEGLERAREVADLHPHAAAFQPVVDIVAGELGRLGEKRLGGRGLVGVEQRRLGVLGARLLEPQARLLVAETGAAGRDQRVDAGEGGMGAGEIAAVEGVDRGVDLGAPVGVDTADLLEVRLGAPHLLGQRRRLLGREVALAFGDREHEADVDDRRLLDDDVAPGARPADEGRRAVGRVRPAA